jgi:hypothetical protein
MCKSDFCRFALGLSIVGWAWPQTAHAQRVVPIPIVHGSGERIVHVCELPEPAKQQVHEETGSPNVAVGFLYWRSHLYGLEMWTSNGRHVLYSRDRYWEPRDPAVWVSLLGEEESQALRKPFSYYVPSGWFFIGGVIVVGTVGLRTWKRASRNATLGLERATQLMQDERYQKAVQMVRSARSQTGEPALASTNGGSSASLAIGVAFLQQRGVPEEEARENLTFLFGFLANTT